MTAAPHAAEKIVSLDRARAVVERWRAVGERVAIACGSFDVLDVGTPRRLSQARGAGRLVVAVRGDVTAHDRLGIDRPLLGVRDRAFLVAALRGVDLVIALETPDAEPALAGLAAGAGVHEMDPPDADPTADTVARVRAHLARTRA